MPLISKLFLFIKNIESFIVIYSAHLVNDFLPRSRIFQTKMFSHLAEGQFSHFNFPSLFLYREINNH